MVKNIETICYELVRPILDLIAWAYDLLLSFTNNNPFDGIETFTDAIYVFSGIFVLFRLAISLLNYLINPDSLSDKSSGGAKIISRVIISVILIVSAPFVFGKLLDLQTSIVSADGGIIFRIFNFNKGTASGSLNNFQIIYEDSKCAMTSGSNLAATVAGAFIEYKGDGSKTDFDNSLNGSFARGGACAGLLSKYHSNMTAYFENEQASISFLTALICGIGVVAFILIMAIDIVVRHLKLIVLQMISPVAFISYMNPKDKIFDQWLKSYGSVYADLFIKLIALVFLVQLIAIVNNFGVSGVSLIFYIMGIFVFAKVLPDFISKIFGIDGMGSFKESANMLKKGLGFGAGAAALAAGGLLAASRANKAQRQQRRNKGENFKARWDKANNLEGKDRRKAKRQALRDSFGSGVSQFGRTAKMVASNTIKGAGAGFQGKGISSTFSESVAEGENLATAIEGGATFRQRTLAGINKTLGTSFGGGTLIKQQKEAAKAVDSANKDAIDWAKTEVEKKDIGGVQTARIKLDRALKASETGNYLEVLKEYGIDYKGMSEAEMRQTADKMIVNAKNAFSNLQKAAADAYLTGKTEFSYEGIKEGQVDLAKGVKGKEITKMISDSEEGLGKIQAIMEAVSAAKNAGALHEDFELELNASGGISVSVSGESAEKAKGKDIFKYFADKSIAKSTELAKKSEEGYGAAQTYVDNKKK